MSNSYYSNKNNEIVNVQIEKMLQMTEEANLSDKDKDGNLLELNDMYKKLTSIIYTTSSFGGEINKIDLPQSNTNFNDFVEYSNKFVNNAKHKTDEIHKLIIKGEKHGK